MARGGNLPEDLRVVGRVLADREEQRLGAVVCERRQHRGRMVRPRAIVKRKNDFARLQEVMLFEVLEAEAGSACRVDLYRALDPQGIGIAGT